MAMTYDSVVQATRKKFLNADVSSVSGPLAFQINLIGKVEGIFYIEIKDGQVHVEPYEYYEDQKVVGIDPDIAQAVCDVLGYDLKIEDMEFDAIVNAVVSGKVDFGAAGMTVTDERKLSVDFTDTYATASQVIIVTK